MVIDFYNRNGGGGSADYATSAGTADISNSTKLLEGGSALPQSANTGDVVAVAPAPVLLSTRGTKGLRSANTALGIYQYDGSEWNPIGGETPDLTSLKPVSELPESGETGEVVALASESEGLPLGTTFEERNDLGPNEDQTGGRFSFTIGAFDGIEEADAVYIGKVITPNDGEVLLYIYGNEWRTGGAVFTDANGNIYISMGPDSDSAGDYPDDGAVFTYQYTSSSDEYMVVDIYPEDGGEVVFDIPEGSEEIGIYQYDGSEWNPIGGETPDLTSLKPVSELPVSGETGEVVALAYDVERPTAPNSGSVYGGAIDAFIDAIEASPNGRVVIQNGDSSDWTDWGYFEKQNDVYGYYDYQAEVWYPFDSMTEGWNDDIYWYPMQRIGDNVFFYDRRNDGSTFFTPSINMMFNVVGQVADGVYQYNGEEWIKIGENETYQVNLSTTAPDSFTQDDIDNLNAFFTKCAEDHSLPVRTFINAAGNIYHNSYVGFTDNQNAEMYFILAFQDYLEQMNLYFADGEYSNGSLTGNSIGSPYNEYGNLLGVGLHDTEADKVIKFDIDNDPDDYTIGSYQAVGEGDSNVYVKEKSIVTSTNIKRMVKITESDYDTLVNNDEVDDDTFYIVVPDAI